MGCILLAVNALLCVGTMMMLESAMRRVGSRTYSETMFLSSGKGMQIAGDIAMAVKLQGVMVAYQQIVPGSILDMMRDTGVIEIPEPGEPSPCLLYTSPSPRD